MHEDTAPHDIITLDLEPLRVNRLLAQSRAANLICAAMLIAAIVLAAILLSRAWPPRSLAVEPAHSSWPQRDGDRIAALDAVEHERSDASEHEQHGHAHQRCAA